MRNSLRSSSSAPRLWAVERTGWWQMGVVFDGDGGEAATKLAGFLAWPARPPESVSARTEPGLLQEDQCRFLARLVFIRDATLMRGLRLMGCGLCKLRRWAAGTRGWST